MRAAGIDIGARSVKVVLLEGDAVVARVEEHTGFEPGAAVRRALASALGAAGLDESSLDARTATGAARLDAGVDAVITEVGAVARGMHALDPLVRTIVDLGAEEARGLRVGQDGGVVDFVVNEKCAAGSGAFVEAMARAMEMTLEEFGRIALSSQRSVPMNAQCAVFAESEVVGLVHSDTPPQDIARAVLDSIARRIVSMVRRIGIEEKVALVGGLARSAGFCDALERCLGEHVVVPEHPAFVGALGAALAAAGRERP